MKLKIKHIGIVESAEIILDSITVIAGYNSTGKSTVGKSLYSIATALSEIAPEKLLLHKIDSVEMELRKLNRVTEVDENLKEVLSNIVDESNYYKWDIKKASSNEIEIYDLEKQFVNNMKRNFQLLGSELSHSSISNYKKTSNIVENLLELLNQSIDSESIKFNIFQQVFNSEFNGQVSNLTDEASKSYLMLEEVNQSKVELQFYNSKIIPNESKVSINRSFSPPIYIESPFVLDDVENRYYFSREAMKYTHKNSLSKLLRDYDSNAENVFVSQFNSEKIDEIFEEIIQGQLNLRSTKHLLNHSKGFERSLVVSNLSAGMKSFSLLSILKDSGALQNCEYIILDEPEIHLHPEWQLKYAELIVLLSKVFSIKFIITSHSPYFIEAIELYSKKHLLNENVRYYKTIYNSLENLSSISEVTNDVSELYDDLANAMFTLEELREEVEEQMENRTE